MVKKQKQLINKPVELSNLGMLKERVAAEEALEMKQIWFNIDRVRALIGKVAEPAKHPTLKKILEQVGMTTGLCHWFDIEQMRYLSECFENEEAAA